MFENYMISVPIYNSLHSTAVLLRLQQELNQEVFWLIAIPLRFYHGLALQSSSVFLTVFIIIIFFLGAKGFICGCHVLPTTCTLMKFL